jgi:hypothetical protein
MRMQRGPIYCPKLSHFVPMQKNAGDRRDQAFHATGALQDITFPLCKEMRYAARKVSPDTPDLLLDAMERLDLGECLFIQCRRALKSSGPKSSRCVMII